MTRHGWRWRSSKRGPDQDQRRPAGKLQWDDRRMDGDTSDKFSDDSLLHWIMAKWRGTIDNGDCLHDRARE
jgi:hypothetical protein